MEVRAARSADAEELARLAGELGYAVSAERMERRLETLAGEAGELLLVAEAGERVLGFVHGQLRRGLLGPRRVEIVALVVDAEARRRGAGRRLVEAVAQWAVELGLGAVRVRTDVRREDAAAFYRALGFVESKRQRVYERSPARPTAAAPDGR